MMTILALMTAAVVPVYQGSLSWTQRDRAVREFVAMMKYAQERAVADAAEYRFYVNLDKGTYWIMRAAPPEKDAEAGADEVEFVPVTDAGATGRTLPATLSLRGSKARRDRDRDAHFVAFYPGGACDYATLKLSGDDFDRVTIATKGRLGQFEVDES
ncbi:MAG: hypothetical protein GY851_11760 [bacterium]|nr:hypothetical protein [bacterium]